MIKLSGVSETLLISLYARYLEHRRADAIIRDEKAAELVEKLDYDFSQFGDLGMVQVATAVRTEILDRGARAFLERHPSAVVVNLGAGLCTRFFRLDNGQVSWFELDLPQVKTVWDEFFEETERHKFLARSFLDFAWFDDLAEYKGADFLFILEGISMYLREDEMKRLLRGMSEAFPGAEVLVEVLGTFFARGGKAFTPVSRTTADFRWGTNDLKELESWGPAIKLLDVWYYTDFHRERWGLFRLLTNLPAVRAQMKIGRFRFTS